MNIYSIHMIPLASNALCDWLLYTPWFGEDHLASWWIGELYTAGKSIKETLEYERTKSNESYYMDTPIIPFAEFLVHVIKLEEDK